MNTEPQQHDNKIFLDASLGVLFTIASVAYLMAHAASLAELHMQFLLLPALLGISGLYLLYKAIKKDRYRLKHQL